MLLCSTNEVLVQKSSLLSYAFPMHYFPMPCNMYPTFRDYKPSRMCCHFFPLKETRNLLLLPSTVIDQRVLLNWLVIRENLIFFLPSSLSPQWRGHWREQEYITKRSLEFLLGLFRKLHPAQVHTTSHFTRHSALKIQELQRIPVTVFQKTLCLWM